MTKQEQIKSELLKLDSNLKTAEQIDENIKIQDYTIELNSINIINFMFMFRESSNSGMGDCWLQCEYYSKRLDRYVIFDYDVNQIYTPSDDGTITAIDDFAMTLADYEDRINVFESRITFNQ